MSEQNIMHKISSLLHNDGVSIFGVATVKQPSLPRRISPEILLKDTRSIVCFGVQIPKGVVYAEHDSLDLYWRYCNMQYRQLDSVSNKLCLFFEEINRVTTPIYSCFPWKIVDREFLGNLPLVYWAEEAGLGRLAKCGLLVTPQYGTRVLLGGVMTTQKLEPTEKLYEEICPSNCFDCIDACPVKAIRRTGRVDHNSCIRHSSSNPLLTLALSNSEITENYTFETLLNTIAVDDHGTYQCFECLKACPLNKG